VTEQELRALRLVGFAIAFAAALGLQRLSPHGRTPGSTRVNGGLWLVNIAVTGTICGACVCTAARWAADSGIGLLNWYAVPAWAAFPVSVAFLDLVSYGWHRANHAVPFLWRWHQVHHSDTAFSVSTALRFHPGELVLSLPVRLAAVLLLGVPVAAVVLFEVAFTLANAIEHGDIDLPKRFETATARVFVTPALHRWHHTTSVPDRDSNFGTVFAIWDRWLGTYAANDSSTAVQTGLPGTPHVTFAQALLLPLRRAPGPAGVSRT
jgi:sterol desaturase/sphingolipid hydroxylase (fatty acid hydroxylase superfamily)